MFSGHWSLVIGCLGVWIVPQLAALRNMRLCGEVVSDGDGDSPVTITYYLTTIHVLLFLFVSMYNVFNNPGLSR